MADRQAADIFSSVFELLAQDEPIDRRRVALDFWKQAHQYDFSWEQMECDEALIKLGLATRVEDGGVEYGPVQREHEPPSNALRRIAMLRESINFVESAICQIEMGAYLSETYFMNLEEAQVRLGVPHMRRKPSAEDN